jgi:hypothetical protein
MAVRRSKLHGPDGGVDVVSIRPIDVAKGAIWCRRTYTGYYCPGLFLGLRFQFGEKKEQVLCGKVYNTIRSGFTLKP